MLGTNMYFQIVTKVFQTIPERWRKLVDNFIKIFRKCNPKNKTANEDWRCVA
jgi:hypothetical protein